MDTRLPRPRPSIQEQIERYRTVVADVFAHHHRVCEQGGCSECSCGGSWPCAAECLAAQLLDWVD